VDTIGGVVHVGNAGSAPAWTATRVVRIGSEEDGPAGFGRIRSIIADAAGQVYVADNQKNAIEVFGADGRHLRTIGRVGSGPGEFRDLYSIAWLDESLVAMDPRNARHSIVSPEGALLRHVPGRVLTGPSTFMRLFPAGTTGAYTPVINAQGELAYVRLTSAGIADTLLAPKRPADAVSYAVFCRRPDGGVTGVAPAELPTSVYAFPTPGGTIASAWTERYAVAVVAGAGDTVRIITRDMPPLAYPDSLWDEATAELRALHEEYPGTECEPADLRRPPARAIIRHLTFDDTGRMWAEIATGGGFVWEIFSPDGALLGSVPAPTRSTSVPPYVRGNRLYVVETDTIGVQYVAAYAIDSAQ